MEIEETEFNDFMSAWDDSDGNQTEETNDQVDEVAETGDGQSDEAEIEETGNQQKESEHEGGNDDEKPDSKVSEEVFTLKINKEEKTFNREEVISLAQKGADYDRVKEQLATSRQAEADLRAQMSVLEDVAKESGTDVATLLDNLQIGMMQKRDNISAEVAKERLLRQKAEKETADLKAAAKAVEKQPNAKEKAQEDVAAFRKEFPDVELNQELMDKLLPSVKQGKSLSDSYRQYNADQQAKRIAELEAALAAEKQNKANRASSPGSQKDSGGKRTKDDFEDFMKAFS